MLVLDIVSVSLSKYMSSCPNKVLLINLNSKLLHQPLSYEQMKHHCLLDILRWKDQVMMVV